MKTSKQTYLSPRIYGYSLYVERGFAESESTETDFSLDDVPEVDGEW